jgi:hypothetical protein
MLGIFTDCNASALIDYLCKIARAQFNFLFGRAA